MNKEILITRKFGGQVGNQLWGIAPFIVKSLIEDKTIIIPNLSDYSHFFENLNQFPNILFVEEDNKVNFPHEADSVKLLDCWREYLDVDLSTKFTELHKIFTPHPKHTSKADKAFLSKRKLFDIIIGVHIRKSDYKRWMNGAFYYNDLIYLSYMRQVKDIFKDKEIGFLLCSDEPISHNRYKYFDTFSIDNADLMDDLYGLSLCDYIIGPPSTFSLWAGFYGKTPLCLLTSSNSEITLDKFSIPISHKELADGQVASYFMMKKEETIYLW